MPDQEIKVVARTQVEGLSEAVEKFARFSGSINDTQAAMRKIGALGQEAVRAGGVLTPDDMERMIRHLDTLKRAEAEINRQLAERKDRVQGIVKEAEANPTIRALLRQGVPLHDAITAQLRGVGGRTIGGVGGGSEDFGALQKEIAALEARRARVAEALPQADMIANAIGVKVGEAQEKALDRWLPRFSQILTTGLSLVGVGGAFAIAAQARGRAIEFYPRAADVAAFLGHGSRGAAGTALRAAGPYGMYPGEALNIAQEIGAAGGRLTPEMIQESAGMGLFMGLGREGYAHMGREAVAGGRFQNLAQFQRFGMIAGGLAESHGLTPGQRTYFLESNKNLIEQMTAWYGGRPLSVEDYFRGMNSLLMATRGSGLPMGGAPTAMEAAANLAQGLSPVGKSFADVIKTGIMLGITTDDALATGKGLYFGFQQKISDRMRSPEGFVGIVQGFAKFLGMQTGPGAQLGSGDMDKLAAVAQNVPGMLQALGQLNTAGVPLGRILQQTPGESLPGDLTETMRNVLEATREAAQQGWRETDIDWAKKQIEGMGASIMRMEETVKTALGPGGAVALSLGMSVASLLPSIITGTAIGTAVGSSIGGTGGGSALLKLLKLGGAAALLTAPFTLSGEGWGTHRKATEPGGRMLSPEEFREMERKALSGEIETKPGMEKPLLMELVNGLWVLSKEVARLVETTEANTRVTEENTKGAGDDKSAGGGVRPGANRPRAPRY